jgi:hypothetical protein
MPLLRWERVWILLIFKELPGHFNIKTTERYLQVRKEKLVNIVSDREILQFKASLKWISAMAKENKSEIGYTTFLIIKDIRFGNFYFNNP